MASNLNIFGNVLKQEGTSRDERYPEALNPANLVLDDRKLQDFIVFAQRYSKNLLFLDTNAGTAGPQKSWEEFFKSDPILLIANIATKDTEEIRSVFNYLKKQFDEEISIDHFRKVAAYVFAAFIRIDSWYAFSTGGDLQDDLTMYIRSYLYEDLKKLLAIRLYLDQVSKNTAAGTPSQPQLKNKNNIWSLEPQASPSLGDASFAGKNEEEKFRNGMIALNAIFDVVYSVTRNIVAAAKRYFEHFDQHDHQPHVALFIAFIKLYGIVQQEYNKIPQRHLDFYYKKALKILPKKAEPDQVYVLLELARGFESFEMKKGALLSAGKDKTNQERLYAIEKDILVTKARVSALKTVCIDKENGKYLRYHARSIGQPGDTSFPPISENEPIRPFGDASRETEISLGFAIASTQFYLSKGERKVSIQIGLKNDPLFERYDTNIFTLLLTGEKGWISDQDAGNFITIDSVNKISVNHLELNFTIGMAQASPVIAFNKKIHAGNFQTSYPVMQLLLKFPRKPRKDDPEILSYDTKIAQLNDFQAMQFSAAAIRVQVGAIASKLSFDGVTDLLVENHESVLDPAKPFYPFTAMPRVGSSFYIGCSDLFYKNIQRFSLNIEWMLPFNFRSYYEKYFPPYDANKFRAALSMLKDKEWKKIDDISLINTAQNNGKYRSIGVNLEKAALTNEATETENNLSKFNASRKDGTLKLKLLYPDFGHDIYPQLITSTVMEKSASKLAEVDFYKVVKKQLYDSVISIKLPDDINSKTGTLKIVVYQNLELNKNDDQAKESMIAGLFKIIQTFNGTNIELRQIREMLDQTSQKTGSETVINDNSFLARIIMFLKKIKVIDKHTYLDDDQEDVGNVVDDLKEKIVVKSSNIMPSDRELTALIISEINRAINQIVIAIVDELLIMRKTAMPDEAAVSTLIRKEVDAANEVINDMISRKIAVLLSAQDIPPKPYTPLINSISLSYISTKTLEKGYDQFFQILPFGVVEINPFETGAVKTRRQDPVVPTDRLLPGSILTAEGRADPSGMLMIGIRDIKPDQNLSLFFQFTEGSKKNDQQPPPITWWYLKKNAWLLLQEDSLISDTTYGLQTTGIVEICLPADADNANTSFDIGGLFWIAISVPENTDAFPHLVNVRTQGVLATFLDKGNDPLHLAAPLRPGSIVRTLEIAPGIKSATQPAASFNGKMKESEEEYYPRVSERLRHKRRLICNWDYERMILEEFPSIFKVKCINNYYLNQAVPGHITVVPIMSLKNKSASAINLEIPRAGYLDLRKIEAFVSARCSPFVTIHAVNAEVNYVQVSGKVRFRNGKDKGLYLNKLNDDLIGFLTPWAAKDKQETSFSTKVYLSSIIRFIDDREYVEYVREVEMYQYKEENGPQEMNRIYIKAANGKRSLYETESVAQHSILASAPKHHFEHI